MRSKITALLSILLFTSLAFSQTKYTEFKVGLLSPADAKTGFYGSMQLGRAIDRNLGIGIEFNVYKKSFNKEEQIDSTNTPALPTTTIQRTFEQNTWLFPIFVNFQYLGQITREINFKVTAGLGYEFLWANYNDFENDQEKDYFFNGFAWHVDLGASYPLSRASDLFGEVTYHSGKPSKDEKKVNGFPTRTEVDMSGLGFRIGLRVYNFGF
jgi:hypothetical protein